MSPSIMILQGFILFTLAKIIIILSRQAGMGRILTDNLEEVRITESK